MTSGLSSFKDRFKSIQSIKAEFRGSFENLLQKDRELLESLNSTTLIATPERRKRDDYFSADSDEHLSMKDNFDLFLESICHHMQSSEKQGNALTVGCGTSHSQVDGPYLEEMLADRAWRILYASIGPKRFADMLLNKIILRRLPNGAYYQMAGPFITDQETKQECDDQIIRTSSKRAKANADSPFYNYQHTFMSELRWKQANFSEYLNNIMKCTTEIKKQKKEEKLEKNLSTVTDHRLVLKDQINACQPTKPSIRIGPNRLYFARNIISKSNGKLLMKLPKNHILRDCVQDALKESYTEHCLRKIFPSEFTTQSKRRRFLKGYSKLQSIIDQLYTNHKALNRHALLRKLCPKRKLHKHAEDLTVVMSSHAEVFRFMKEVIKSTFPLEFWGSDHNFAIICQRVHDYIRCMYGETLSYAEIIYQFRSSDCTWLRRNADNEQRVSREERKKRDTLLQQAVVWFFNDFVEPILKAFFYVTDHAKLGKVTCYFRRDVWFELTKAKFCSLMEEKYLEHVHDTTVLYDLQLGVGKLRFKPKGDKLRMITNMRTTHVPQIGGETEVINANSLLKPALEFLTFVTKQQTDLLGNSILSKSELHKQYKRYRSRMASKEHQKYYFIKFDISNCFDNIDNNTMLDIIDRIVSDKVYVKQTIYQLYPTLFGGSAIKKIVGFFEENNIEHNRQQLKKLTDDQKNSIYFVKDTNKRRVNFDQIRNILEDIINTSYIQYEGEYYKKSRGLPQGCSLSSLLCSLFLSAMEKEVLASFGSDKNSVLFRYVDDYLYITTDIQRAEQFMDIISTELSKFGIHINRDKSKSNLTKDINAISWIGFDFNTQNLEVTQTKTDRSIILNSLPVNTSDPYISTLENLVIRTIHANWHSILFDIEINSRRTIRGNLYHIFETAARRTEIYTTKRANTPTGFIRQELITTLIIQIGNRIIPLTPKGLSKSDILYEFYRAFHHVYSRKHTKYSKVVHFLKYALRKRKY